MLLDPNTFATCHLAQPFVCTSYPWPVLFADRKIARPRSTKEFNLNRFCGRRRRRPRSRCSSLNEKYSLVLPYVSKCRDYVRTLDRLEMDPLHGDIHYTLSDIVPFTQIILILFPICTLANTVFQWFQSRISMINYITPFHLNKLHNLRNSRPFRRDAHLIRVSSYDIIAIGTAHLLLHIGVGAISFTSQLYPIHLHLSDARWEFI